MLSLGNGTKKGNRKNSVGWKNWLGRSKVKQKNDQKEEVR